MDAKCENRYLNSEQIKMLKEMLDKYHNKWVRICECDIERVLNIHEKESNKILVTMDDMQFIALQNIVVNYKNGQRMEYSTRDIRKLYLNKDEVRDIQEQQRHLRKE